MLRLLDLFSNINKHILGPRAKTQEEMNLSFQGTFCNIGERYTDFTKVLFVVFFYSSLFPSGFFFGFLILWFQYLVDKFSLVRIWSWAPLIGPELAVFSRQFFFTGAALTFCVVSTYAFAQFPYDNLCDTIAPTNSTTKGDPLSACTAELDTVVVDLDTTYEFCDQSWR